MNFLLEARQKLAKLLKEEREILESQVKESRVGSETEETRLAAIEQEKKSLVVTIARLEQNAADIAASSVDAPNGSAPSAIDTQPAARGTAPRVTVGREDGEDEHGRYRPYRSLGEQMQAVINAARNPLRADSRLMDMQKRAAAGLSEGVGADGGFLLQDDFSATLMRNAVDTGIIAPLCTRMPTSPGSTGIVFPVVEETSRVEGSRWGGIRVYRVNESGQGTYAKPKFSQARMGFEKMIGLVALTDEIIADATFLNSWVSQGFAEEISVKIDNEIVRGTGAGEMLGVLNANCLVTVSKETSQPAATIDGMNVVKMFARLFARSQSNAVWLANQSCFPQLSTLTITKNKSDVPLYSPPQLAAGQPSATILGRPVRYVEQCSALGTRGDLILADFSRYIIIEKDLQQASSVHVYFDTEQTALRFSVRNNGMPLLKQAVTPMNGSDTLTDFVVLENRA